MVFELLQVRGRDQQGSDAFFTLLIFCHGDWRSVLLVVAVLLWSAVVVGVVRQCRMDTFSVVVRIAMVVSTS